MAQLTLSRFKRTNNPPSELEALQVREVADEARDKLSSIEARINRLQGTPGSAVSIGTLRRDEASLRRKIETCHSILSLARRIPPEILTHIFLCTTPSIEDARRVQWH